MTDNNDTEMVDRYVELTVTVGFWNNQLGELMAKVPEVAPTDLFVAGAEGLLDLALTNGAGTSERLLDTAGVFDMFREELGSNGIRVAVRYRESEEVAPHLYSDNPEDHFKNPTPMGGDDWTPGPVSVETEVPDADSQQA